MKEEEITALAREYAEEIYRNAHKEMKVLPNCLSNEAVNMFAEDMESKLKWLLRRFCLVEKGKVIAEYQQAKALFDEARKENALYVLAPMATKLQVLNLMYPEILKEVEG